MDGLEKLFMEELERLINDEESVVVVLTQMEIGYGVCFAHVISIASQTVIKEFKENPYYPVIESSTDPAMKQELVLYAEALKSDPIGNVQQSESLLKHSTSYGELKLPAMGKSMLEPRALCHFSALYVPLPPVESTTTTPLTHRIENNSATHSATPIPSFVPGNYSRAYEHFWTPVAPICLSRASPRGRSS
ncbi:hypothetical protein DFH09DRAFT_1083957 [Mycena vulgaris]|nr:hypothetical protein DFH09DRAFT_1083957 [Mycena vulgaris]